MMIGKALGLCSTAGMGGTDYVAQILGAGGLDYAEFDFARLPLLFQDTAGATPVTAIGQTIGRANVKAKALHNAQQATSSFRPQYQAAGAKFDGSDDNLLTDWLAQAGANCLITQVSVPVSVPTVLAIAGAQDASSTNRYWLAVGSGGSINAAVGAALTGSIGSDVRGTDIIVALTFDGTTVKVFLNGAEVYSGAQSGVPTTLIPLRIGANNVNNTPASYWPGSVRRLALGRKNITLAEFQQIRSQWLAAA